MNKKVSIIIPVYNAENYLEECIKSILCQTYKNLEILLVNDGSTDKSGSICDQYKNIDDRIIVYHRKNSGVSSTRNFALDKATGEFIMFIDSDDYVDSNFVQKSIYNYSKDCLVVFGFTELYQNQEFRIVSSKEQVYRNNIYDCLFKYNYVGGFCWNKLYERNIIEINKIRFDSNIKICEDLFFNLKYIQYISCIKIINECLYFYRMRGSSTTWEINKEKINNHENCLNEIHLFLEKKNLISDDFLFYKLTSIYKYGQKTKEYKNDFKRVLFSKKLSLKNKIKLLVFRYGFFIYKYYMNYKRQRYVLYK